jgi:hypothetical protein
MNIFILTYLFVGISYLKTYIKSSLKVSANLWKMKETWGEGLTSLDRPLLFIEITFLEASNSGTPHREQGTRSSSKHVDKDDLQCAAFKV